MPDKNVFIDTNIWIYLLSENDLDKQKKAKSY